MFIVRVSFSLLGLYFLGNKNYYFGLIKNAEMTQKLKSMRLFHKKHRKLKRYNNRSFFEVRLLYKNDNICLVNIILCML